MLSRVTLLVCAFSMAGFSSAGAQSASLDESIALIRKHLHGDYAGMLRDEGGAFKFPFITPGSAQYADILWDWDSWLSNVALRQILAEKATPEEKAKALKHEQGCVLNYLNYGAFDGWIPIILLRDSVLSPDPLSREKLLHA